jgi:hypothetical protein
LREKEGGRRDITMAEITLAGREGSEKKNLRRE